MEGIILGIGFIGVILVLLTRFLKTGIFLTLASFVGYFYFIEINSWLPIILFAVGLLLIVLEVFIPDFGILGIIGLISIIGGLYITSGNWMEAIQDFGLAVIFTGAVSFFLVRNGMTENRWEKFVLKADGKEKPNRDEIDDPYAFYVGQIGRTNTRLRPTGWAEFEFEDGTVREADVTSEIEAVEVNQPIRIIKIQGTKIIVRSVD